MLRDHRTTEQLKAIVNRAGSGHPTREVERAKRELTLRREPEEAAFQRKLTLSSTVSAVIGAFLVVWPLLMLGTLRLSGFGHATDPGVHPGEPFVFRHFDQLFIGVAVLQSVAGLLLFGGGLATRARRPIGPRLVAIALWMGISYAIAFTLMTIPSVFAFGGPLVVWLGFSLMAVLNTAFWAFVLWLPLRFFSSPRTREACTAWTG